MGTTCHRCHEELPGGIAANAVNDEHALLFCARCGAPQLLLPEHMRVEGAIKTTGAIPPPRPAGALALGAVDWRAALGSAALVAAVGGGLTVAGLRWPGAMLICLVWTMSGAATAMGFYARRSPHARVDAKVGMRIGLATGLLHFVAICMALASTGVVLRFGTHGMGAWDEAQMAQRSVLEAKWTELLQMQPQGAEVQAEVRRWTASPEFWAASVILNVGFSGGVILLLSAAGGAFAGMLRMRRTRLEHGK